MNHDLVRSLIRGHIYRAAMKNGAQFEVWSPERLSPIEAKRMLLAQANGDYVGVYGARDVARIWSARS